MAKALIPLLAATAALFAAAPSRGQDFIIVNGLPCNAFCQSYMSVRPQPMFRAAGRPPAIERSEPLPKRRSPASRRAEEESDEDRPPVHPRHGAPARKKREASAPACEGDGAGREGACNPSETLKMKRPVLKGAVAARPQPFSSPVADKGPPAGATEEPSRSPESVAPSLTPPPEPGKAQPQSADKAPDPSPSPATPKSEAAGAAGSQYNVLIVLADGVDAKLSDLNQKTIVIAGPASLSREAVMRAMAAAGLASVTVSEGSKADVDNLVKGSVSAAIVACLPPSKAQAFPAIQGFALFKVLIAKSEANCV